MAGDELEYVEYEVPAEYYIGGSFTGCELQNGNFDVGEGTFWYVDEVLGVDTPGIFAFAEQDDYVTVRVPADYAAGDEINFSIRVLDTTLENMFVTPGAFPCSATMKRATDGVTQRVRFLFTDLNPKATVDLEFGPLAAGTTELDDTQLALAEEACQNQLESLLETSAECNSLSQESSEVVRRGRSLQQVFTVKISMEVVVQGTAELSNGANVGAAVKASLDENGDAFVAELKALATAAGDSTFANVDSLEPIVVTDVSGPPDTGDECSKFDIFCWLGKLFRFLFGWLFE